MLVIAQVELQIETGRTETQRKGYQCHPSHSTPTTHMHTLPPPGLTIIYSNRHHVAPGHDEPDDDRGEDFRHDPQRHVQAASTIMAQEISQDEVALRQGHG